MNPLKGSKLGKHSLVVAPLWGLRIDGVAGRRHHPVTVREILPCAARAAQRRRSKQNAQQIAGFAHRSVPPRAAEHAEQRDRGGGGRCGRHGAGRWKEVLAGRPERSNPAPVSQPASQPPSHQPRTHPATQPASQPASPLQPCRLQGRSPKGLTGRARSG